MSTTESRSAARRERRQKRRAFRKRIHASIIFNKFLRMTFVVWLRRRFRLKSENLETVHELSPPYLLLPNHTCVFDPFLVNSLIRPPVHYVVTDASFRSRLIALGHSLVGSIPKTKVMSDMESMRNIMSVRDRGGVIGIFPEGQSSWDGHTLPLLPSTGKLVKLLKIPVVTARVTGAYLSWPRWAKKGRRGNVRVHFEVAYTPEELQTASPDEIQERIAQLLEQDASEHNRGAKQTFEGEDRAEYLERALFICPACKRLGTLDSSGDEFGCTECGYRVRFNEQGFFEPVNGSLHFETIRDWNLWQTEEYKRRLDQYLEEQPHGPFLAGERVRVQVGRRSEPLSPFHEGALELHADRILLHPDSDEPVEFPLVEIQGANVQNNEHWEFYCGADLYRISTIDPGGCTYKWDMAVRHLAERRAARGGAAANPTRETESKNRSE